MAGESSHRSQHSQPSTDGPNSLTSDLQTLPEGQNTGALEGRHQDEGEPTPGPDETDVPIRRMQHQTACYNCRASRQKCDRRDPCLRCISQARTCQYPSRSNRGRKHGSTNKPDSVKKLLARIDESGARDEVIAAMITPSTSRQTPTNTTNDDSSLSATTGEQQQQRQQQGSHTVPQFQNADVSVALPSESTWVPTNRTHQSVTGPDSSSVSPMQLVTASISTNTIPKCDGLGSRMSLQPERVTSMAPIKDRLCKYFASRSTLQRDWQVLATQSVYSPFKLEGETCDPFRSRLVDENDVAHYFDLFFKIRNPLLGLLDPSLHTAEYVYSASFTLFSTVCGLGCALSTRPRDRAMYAVLMGLATANIQWSIAASIRSLETIQAIVLMQYWAPICESQTEDPYWLYLSHAVQLGREIGIDRADAIAELVKTTATIDCDDHRERLSRNYERTWLISFIADKSFGVIAGRPHSISWTELPAGASEWWKRPMTEPLDYMISGTIEMRGLLVNAAERRQQAGETSAAILDWHCQVTTSLAHLRNTRCSATPSRSTLTYPFLAFYIDHSLLVLNALTMRDITNIDISATSTAMLIMSSRTVEVATRALDLLLSDSGMSDLQMGFHNNLYIMICHAISEIMRAMKRGGLNMNEISMAVEKVLAVPDHLNKTVSQLPTCSAGHMYLDLARYFACQVEALSKTDIPGAVRDIIDQSLFSNDWLRSTDAVLPDFATWLDMGYLGAELPILTSDLGQAGTNLELNGNMFTQ